MFLEVAADNDAALRPLRGPRLRRRRTRGPRYYAQESGTAADALTLRAALPPQLPSQSGYGAGRPGRLTLPPQEGGREP